jgi:hypothetical protein
VPPELLDPFLRWLGGTPCFRIFGKGRPETDWRVIAVYANHRRDLVSPWPLWSGACTTWSAVTIAVGWDFASELLREQMEEPASRQHPVAVTGGRLRDVSRRYGVGARSVPSASEVMAHECGHTWQAKRMGPIYLPLVGSVTLFREGPNPWNRFENEASEQGLYGGLVPNSMCPELVKQLTNTGTSRCRDARRKTLGCSRGLL